MATLRVRSLLQFDILDHRAHDLVVYHPGL